MLQGVDNVDEENLPDPVQVAFYAKGIFEYYKEREVMNLNKVIILIFGIKEPILETF